LRELRNNVVIAPHVSVHRVLLPLFRAATQDLLARKADLPHGSNAIGGRLLEKLSRSVKDLVQESLQKCRHSALVALLEVQKRARDQPAFSETSIEVSTEARKGNSNETITLGFDTGTHRHDVLPDGDGTLPARVNQQELRQLPKAFHSSSL
jgi:hypothetical protein